jgi:hypothetical protein
MGRTLIPSTGRGLISTFGQYYSRTSNSFSGIFGTATYPFRSLSNLNINYYTAGNYMFYLNFASSDAVKGAVSSTYPFSGTASGTNVAGNDKQAYTGTYTYITITCSLNYPYTFKGWYTLPVGGTLITTSATVNVSYTDTYYNNVWYAQFN